VDDLEVALVLMTNIEILYGRMNEQQRTNLLQMFVKRIIINSQGEIIGHELLSPFEYLSALINHSNGENEEESGSEQVRDGSQVKPLDDIERFLSMLRFDSREKTEDFLSSSVFSILIEEILYDLFLFLKFRYHFFLINR